MCFRSVKETATLGAGTVIAALAATVMVYGSSLRVTGPVPPMDNPGKLLNVSDTLPDTHALRSLSMSSEWHESHGIIQPLMQHLQNGVRSVVQDQLHAAESPSQSINGCMHELVADAGTVPWLLPSSGSPVLDSMIGRGTLGSESGPQLGGDRFLGALCLVGNCVAMAGYFVLARRISGDVPASALTVCAPCTSPIWACCWFCGPSILIGCIELVYPSCHRAFSVLACQAMTYHSLAIVQLAQISDATLCRDGLT